jgi:hypothetical protein
VLISIPRPKVQNYLEHRSPELVTAAEVCHDAAFLSLLVSNSEHAHEQLRKEKFCRVTQSHSGMNDFAVTLYLFGTATTARRPSRGGLPSRTWRSPWRAAQRPAAASLAPLDPMVSGMVRQMLHQVPQTDLCFENRNHPSQGFVGYAIHKLNLFPLDFHPL